MCYSKPNMPSSFYNFIQATVYNMDVENTKESRRVKERRARLLGEHNNATSSKVRVQFKKNVSAFTCFVCKTHRKNCSVLCQHFHAYCIEEQSNVDAVVCIDQLTYVRPFDKQYSNESERACIVPYKTYMGCT